MKNNEFISSSNNLSVAWANVFRQLTAPGTVELSPVVVKIEGMLDEIPVESPEIRAQLDKQLMSLGLQSCHTVANTIFPDSLWNEQSNNELLFSRFEKIWPQLRKCPANNLGHYFRRLTHYEPDGAKGWVNQLEHIIETYRKGIHRRSALQAITFDPTRDHKQTPRLKFPCLHQVGLLPDGDDLTITGYYAMQYYVERAYGNFLGLCRLGRFMAHEMGLNFKRMICVASVAKLGTSKKSVRSLAENMETLIKAEHGDENNKSEASAKAAI